MDKVVKEAADLHFKKMVLRYGEITGRDKKAYKKGKSRKVKV